MQVPIIHGFTVLKWGGEFCKRAKDSQLDSSHAENTKSFAIQSSGEKEQGTDVPTLTQYTAPEHSI